MRCKVLASPGCENELRKKIVKRHMVFRLFYCISFRRRLLEGFGCVFFVASHSAVDATWFSCFLFGLIEVCVLEGSGCENQLTKKIKRHMAFLFFLYLIDSGVMFSRVFAACLRCMVPAGPGCENEFRKKEKRHMVFPFFCS